MLANILTKHYSYEFLNFSGLLQALLRDYQITESSFNFFTPFLDVSDDSSKYLYRHCRILESPFLVALFCATKSTIQREVVAPHYQIMLASCTQITEQLRYHCYQSPYDLINSLTIYNGFINPHEYLVIDLPDRIECLNMMDPRGKSALCFLLRLIRIFQNSKNSVNWLATTRSRQQEIFKELVQFLSDKILIKDGRDEPWLEFYFDSGMFGHYIVIKREIFSLQLGIMQIIERRIQLPMILEAFNYEHPEGPNNLWGLRDMLDLLVADLRLRILDA